VVFDSDLLIALSLLCGVIAIPSLINAFSESRFPTAALGLAVVAGGLFVLAARDKPGGIRIDELPDIVFRVIGRLLN